MGGTDSAAIPRRGTSVPLRLWGTDGFMGLGRSRSDADTPRSTWIPIPRPEPEASPDTTGFVFAKAG